MATIKTKVKKTNNFENEINQRRQKKTRKITFKITHRFFDDNDDNKE